MRDAQETIAVRILLVDDNPTLLRTLTRVLAVRGHYLTTAREGTEALEQLEADGPDLVICDVRMPGMDGLAFLRAARTRFPATPVVLMTGYGSRDTTAAAFRDGARDFLKKPLRVEKLLSCIARIARST